MLGLPHGSFTVFVEIHLVFGRSYLQSHHVLGVGGDEQGWSKTQSLAPRAYNLIGHISSFHRKKYFKNQCILELSVSLEKASCGGTCIGLDLVSGSYSTMNSLCGLDTLFLFFRPSFSSL